MNLDQIINSNNDSISESVIVCFLHYNSNQNNDSALEEYKFLIESAGYNINRIFVQKRNPTSTFFFGEGFWENLLTELKNNTEITKIIVNTTLTPLQVFNIGKKLGGQFEILDQFTLILEIFTNHASTEEAMLQIELAKLKYQFPFAKANLVSERVSERIGFRQSGELKSRDLENTYKRLQATINSKLEKIKKQRLTRRNERIAKAQSNEVLTFSLLGYTNAGKSSFLNALTTSEKKVEVANKLFTTLGTTTRRYQYFDLPVIITDTVGFYEALPATLIDAFRSTLEESLITNYVLVLVDISETINQIKRKLLTSLDTIKTIDGNLFSRLWIVLTKIDLIDKKTVKDLKKNIKSIIIDYNIDPNNICSVSSIHNNFKEFNDLISSHIPKYRILINIDTKYKKLESLRSKLYDETKIISEKFHENQLEIQLESHRIDFLKTLFKTGSNEITFKIVK